MIELPWEQAVAMAVTGQALPLEPATRLTEIWPQLAAHGWDRPEIVNHARTIWQQGQPWPHPVPAAAAFGAARWQATLDQLTHELGLDTVTQPPSQRRPLNADERRLLADRPPHY
ncbi:MAG: hypothetical protein LBL92_02580 [Propionibacteriaceae bacterium]|nr:hypothetical protein [Propionibacteriaceae bacterium]